MTPPRNDIRGRAFEEAVEWQNNIYLGQERAAIRKNTLSAIVKRGKVIAIKSLPDFEGTITEQGGRHCSFDAKVTATPTYHHPRERLHQLVALWDIHQAGGVAFLLVNFDPPQSVYQPRCFMVYPDPAWASQHWHSIRLDKMTAQQGIEVECGGGYGLPMWLDAVGALEAARAA